MGSATGRWTFEQESDCALRIREAETHLHQLLQGVDVAAPLLNHQKSKVERTRGGDVERLKEAAELVLDEAKHDRSLRALGRDVRKALTDLEAAHWELATSAMYIANTEARRLRSPFMSHEDLVQEGTIGLLRAAQRFEPERKIRFSTYARWWVRAQVIRSIETKGRMVRLPGGAVEVIRKMRQTRQQYAQAGIRIDIESLAREVGLEVDRARELLEFEGGFHGQDVDIDSEDHPLQLSDDGELADDIVARQEAFLRALGVIESELDERERFIIESRYGLRGETRTMADIGSELGISRERVRQIQTQTLRYLKSVAFSDAA